MRSEGGLKKSVAPFARLQPGRTVGRYSLLREIGRGGMGTVFEATDASNGKQVAVKVLRRGLAGNQVARQRFFREVEAASRVIHPTIIRFLNWGVSDGIPYIAMEYVSGKPLAKFLSPIAPFPLTNTVRIVLQVADGLAAVHRAGLVHRDIKPDNIMVVKDLAIKLTDFGVAKLPGSSLTLAGELWGTLHYMSPEQVQGQLEIDHRSDVYSLGAVLFEMLACRRPFDGEGVGTYLIGRIIADPVPRVSTLKPGIPEAFDGIVGKALAKNPADRYQSCDEFAADLTVAMRTLPVASHLTAVR